jgi:hypothetical protein
VEDDFPVKAPAGPKADEASARGEAERPDGGPVPSRMRFEDPLKFLEFFEKQLSRGVIGLRHPQSIPLGTPFLVVISPPGAPDRLVIQGEVSRVSQRPDGAWRLRVELDQRPEDAAWLDGYVEGLRVTLAWAARADRGPLGDREDAPPARDDRVVAPTSAPPQPRPPTPAPVAGPPSEPTASPGEIRVLAQRLDSLDYYGLLGVARDAEPNDLQQRFHFLTRRFHPDLFHGLEPKLVRQVNQIYRRMNEAYSVLKSPVRRRAYDVGLTQPAGRLRLASDAQDEARRRETVQGGITRPGDFYWTRARQLLESARGRPEWLMPARQEAIRLLRTALFFEPDNTHFRSALDHIESQVPRS